MPYVLLVLTILFWSGNFVLGRGVHTEIPPIALSFWRWGVALLILIPFAIKPLINQRRLIQRNLKILTILALLAITNFNTFIYIALQTATAINTVLVNATTPIFIALVSWAGFKDRLALRQGIGIFISLFGLLWIISRGSPVALLSVRFSKGDLWTLLAALDWAVYTVLLRKRPAGLDPIGFLASIILIGLIFLVPIYIWEILTGAMIQPTRTTAFSILYVAVFPSILSYIFWNRAVGMVGANRAGIFMHLMPVFAIILSIMFLGERLLAYHTIGIGFIFFGIFLVTTVKTKEQATGIPSAIKTDHFKYP